MREMRDIVERLRGEGENVLFRHLSIGMWQLCLDAADVIEAMRSVLTDISSMTADGEGLRAFYHAREKAARMVAKTQSETMTEPSEAKTSA